MREIFVLTFKAHGPHCVRSIRLDCQNKYYALINRARSPYEEIFALAFKAYGPNAVRSMLLECQNKYFLVWTSSSVNKSILRTASQPIRSKNSLQ